jgi:hypothetical protein
VNLFDDLCKKYQDKQFWSIAHSVESDNYDTGGEPRKPRKPWIGKVSVRNRPGGVVLQLHAFNGVTGMIDEDTNAYAIVEESELYETEEAAQEAYAAELGRYVNYRVEELSELMREFTDLAWPAIQPGALQ